MTGSVPEYLKAKGPEVTQDKPVEYGPMPAPKPKPQSSLENQQQKINNQMMSVFGEPETTQYGPTKANANKLAQEKGEAIPYPEAQEQNYSVDQYADPANDYVDPDYKPGPRVENVKRLEESKKALQGTGLEDDVAAQQEMMQLKPEERERFAKMTPAEQQHAMNVYSGRDLENLNSNDKAQLAEYEKQYPGISKMSENGVASNEEMVALYNLHNKNPELADVLLRRKNIDGWENVRYDPSKHLTASENAEKTGDPMELLYRSMLENDKNNLKPSPQSMQLLRNAYLSETDPEKKKQYERYYKFMQGQISSKDYIDITKTEQGASVQKVKGAVEAEKFLVNALLDPKAAIQDFGADKIRGYKGDVINSGIDQAVGPNKKVEPYAMQNISSTGNLKEDINNLMIQEALYNASTGKPLTSQQVEAVLNSPEYRKKMSEINLQNAENQALENKANEYKGYVGTVMGGSGAIHDIGQGYSQGLNEGLTSKESLKNTGTGVLTKFLSDLAGDEVIKAASENEYKDVQPVQVATDEDVYKNMKKSSIK